MVSTRLCWVLVVASTVGCAERMELPPLEAKSFVARAALKTGGFRVTWLGGAEGVVRGELVISGKDGRLEFANLNCLGLSLAGGRQDDGVYVDSPAHVFVEGFKSGADGVVRANVYWLFSGMGEMTLGDLEGSRIFLRCPEPSCVGIAPSPSL